METGIKYAESILELAYSMEIVNPHHDPQARACSAGAINHVRKDTGCQQVAEAAGREVRCCPGSISVD